MQPRSQLLPLVDSLRAASPVPLDDIFMVSALKNSGVDDLKVCTLAVGRAHYRAHLNMNGYALALLRRLMRCEYIEKRERAMMYIGGHLILSNRYTHNPAYPARRSIC